MMGAPNRIDTRAGRRYSTMMREFICAAAALVTLGCMPVRAQDAGGAEAFVRQIYARYAASQTFSPFADLPSVRAIATPGLAQLVQRDRQASAATGDEGGLDADPVCGCQDADGLRLTGVAVAVSGAGRATATATLQFGADRVVRRILLQAVGAEWRIDDITDGNGRGSVRAALARSTAEAQSRRRR